MEGYLTIVRDITERRRAEELLARSESRLKETQSLARLGSWSWDPATDTALWTEELYTILRRDPALPALSFAELLTLFTPESRARIQQSGGRTLATGEPYMLELEQLRCDGEPIWVLACGKAELDASGKVVRMHGTTQDITARKADRLFCIQRIFIQEKIDSVASGPFLLGIDDPIQSGAESFEVRVYGDAAVVQLQVNGPSVSPWRNGKAG